MRHRVHHRKLNRTSAHRAAMLRNMAQSFFEHGQVRTTVPKAKELRPYVERLITLAVRTRTLADQNDKTGSLSARRRIHSLLHDRSLIPNEHRAAYGDMSDAGRMKTLRMASGRRYRTGDPKGRLAFTGESVTHRLIETIAPRFKDRTGGYTRLIRLADRRVGDSSFLAVLQLVGEEEAPVSLTKPGKSARRRRADGRYAMAIKLSKQRARAERPSKSKSEAQSEESTGAGEAAAEGEAAAPSTDD